MGKRTFMTQEFNNQLFIVEPAKPENAEGVFNVQRLTWLATYPNADADISEDDIRIRLEGRHGELIPKKIERWREAIEIGGDKRATFVVKDGGKIVGFVAPGVIDGQRRIGAIYVLPEAQDKGIGGALLNRALDWHGHDKDILLHVASYNKSAIDFYKRNGFEYTGNSIRDEGAQRGAGKEIPEVEMALRAGSK